jgi:hypothetical protein
MVPCAACGDLNVSGIPFCGMCGNNLVPAPGGSGLGKSLLKMGMEIGNNSNNAEVEQMKLKMELEKLKL